MNKIDLIKVRFFIVLFLGIFINANCQTENKTFTQVFADELKKLIELNSHTPNSVDLSSFEAVDLLHNPSPEQIIEITAPYLNSETTNAKNVCLDLLNAALHKNAKTLKERQAVIEVLCKNFLDNDLDLQSVHNSLYMLNEKDFNAPTRKYLETLIEKMPTFIYNEICAKVFAIAQIKKSIPTLWKIVDANTYTMRNKDLDILASLARMNEKEAGKLLCNYYNSIKNRTDYKQIFVSNKIAFSLDRTVLNCLMSDFKSIDVNFRVDDGDSGYWPSQYLGAAIASMLNNYPYAKNDYDLQPKQLLDWLSKIDKLEMKAK